MTTDWPSIKATLADRDVVVRFTTYGPMYTTQTWEFSAKRAWADEARRLVRHDHGVEVVTWGEPQDRTNILRVHPSLHVRCAVRFNGDDGMRVDVCVENPFVDASDLSYGVVIFATTEGGGETRTLLNRKGVSHGKGQRWRFAKWIGTPGSDLDASYDLEAWKAKGAVPNYAKLTPDPATVSGWISRWQESKHDPLRFDLGLWTAYEGHTGDDPEIGLMPQWVALALLSRDPRLLRIVVANDSLFGGMPIHFRDRATLQPLSATIVPTLTIAQPKVPAPQIQRDFDDAHHPLAGAASYLLTGDHWSAEEVEFLANWIDLNSNATYRGGALGLCIDHEQRRSVAWCLRTKFWACWNLPNGRSRFDLTVRANLAKLTASLDNGYHGIRVEGAQNPWFCDTDSKYNPSYNEGYLLAVLGWAKSMGTNTESIVTELAKWPINRWLHWPPEEAAPYLAAVADSHGTAYAINEAHAKTYANRNGEPWNPTYYQTVDDAALAAAEKAGAPNATEARRRCQAAIGGYPWERNPAWSVE